MSKSLLPEAIENRLWERLSPDGVEYDDPFVDEIVKAKFDDLAYKISSLTTAISAYSDLSVDTVIDEDFKLKTPSWSMGITAFWGVTRSLMHAPSLMSLAATAINKESREELLSQPETWQTLLANGGDFLKFIDTNRDFTERLLNKYTGFDVKPKEGEILPENLTRRVVKEDLLPLAESIILAAKEDHMALGAEAGKMLTNFLSYSGNHMDPSLLIGSIFDAAKSTQLINVLGKDENLERISNIMLRAFDTQEKVRENLASYNIDREKFVNIQPLLKGLIKNGLANTENREVIIDTIKLFMPEKPKTGEKIPSSKENLEKLFVNLKILFSDTDLSKSLNKPENVKALATTIMPICATIDGITSLVDAKVLNGSSELGEQLIGSFLRDPEQITRFKDVLLAPTNEKRATSALELFGADDVLRKKALEGPKDSSSSPTMQLAEVIGNLLTNVLTSPDAPTAPTKADVEWKEQLGTYFKVASPVIIGLLKNAIEGDQNDKVAATLEALDKLSAAGAAISSAQASMLKINSPSSKTEVERVIREAKAMQNEELTKLIISGTELLLTKEQSDTLSSLPIEISKNKTKLVETLRPLLATTPLASRAEQLVDMLSNPEIIKRAVDLGNAYYGDKSSLHIAGKAADMLISSPEVRGMMSTITIDAIKVAFKGIFTPTKPKDSAAVVSPVLVTESAIGGAAMSMPITIDEKTPAPSVVPAAPESISAAVASGVSAVEPSISAAEVAPASVTEPVMSAAMPSVEPIIEPAASKISSAQSNQGFFSRIKSYLFGPKKEISLLSNSEINPGFFSRIKSYLFGPKKETNLISANTASAADSVERSVSNTSSASTVSSISADPALAVDTIEKNISNANSISASAGSVSIKSMVERNVIRDSSGSEISQAANKNTFTERYGKRPASNVLSGITANPSPKNPPGRNGV